MAAKRRGAYRAKARGNRPVAKPPKIKQPKPKAMTTRSAKAVGTAKIKTRKIARPNPRAVQRANAKASFKRGDVLRQPQMGIPTGEVPSVRQLPAMQMNQIGPITGGPTKQQAVYGQTLARRKRLMSGM